MTARAPAAPSGPFRGLYVHVPFCLTKCPYCAFASATLDRCVGAIHELPPLLDRYVTAILTEAALGQGSTFDTVYLGGGTPSVLGPERLVRLLEGLRARVTIAPGAELTVEANPGDVTPTLIAALVGAGMTRLSLGAQSFVNSDLAFLGRRHDAGAVRESIKMARHGGVPAIGLDLIYGVPGQSAAAWRRSVDEAVAWRPEHVSMYALTLEEGTPLGAAVAQGRVRAVTDEVLRRRFLSASERFDGAGYEHYEVSNLALPGHRSRHNGAYWRRVPYLGLGPSAHSFDGARRWWNVRDTDGWLAAIEHGREPRVEVEVLTPEQERLEDLALGLRTGDGIDEGLVRGEPAWRVVRELERGGLVTRDGSRIRPTRRGLFVADGMAARLA